MEIIEGSTDEKIVNATFNILQKEGAKKATTKKIAAEAGVNEITIFRKFKTKSNLIEVVKEHHLQIFIDKLENIFDFNEDEEIEEYLRSNFYELANLSDADFSIMKIAMEEVHEIPEKKLIITRVTDVIIDKLEEFFILQKEKDEIKQDIDARVLAVMCFGMTFQSVVLWKIYNKTPDVETIHYGNEFRNILFNGIKP
jgi:AcrR family transcriptional regulator